MKAKVDYYELLVIPYSLLAAQSYNRPSAVASKEAATETLIDRGWLAPVTPSDTKGKTREAGPDPEDVEMDGASQDSQELVKVHYSYMHT